MILSSTIFLLENDRLDDEGFAKHADTLVVKVDRYRGVAIQFLYDKNRIDHYTLVILLAREKLQFTDIRDIRTVIKFD